MSKRAGSITRHLLADLCFDCATALRRGPDAEAERIALHLVGVADGTAWSKLAALTSKPGRVPEARRILAELVHSNAAAARQIDAQAPNDAQARG